MTGPMYRQTYLAYGWPVVSGEGSTLGLCILALKGRASHVLGSNRCVIWPVESIIFRSVSFPSKVERAARCLVVHPSPPYSSRGSLRGLYGGDWAAPSISYHMSLIIPSFKSMHVLRAMLVGGPIGALGLFGFVWWIAKHPADDHYMVGVYAFILILGWAMGWAGVYAQHLERANRIRWEAHLQAKRDYRQSIHDDFDHLLGELSDQPELAAQLAAIRRKAGFGP